MGVPQVFCGGINVQNEEIGTRAAVAPAAQAAYSKEKEEEEQCGRAGSMYSHCVTGDVHMQTVCLAVGRQ